MTYVRIKYISFFLELTSSNIESYNSQLLCVWIQFYSYFFCLDTRNIYGDTALYPYGSYILMDFRKSFPNSYTLPLPLEVFWITKRKIWTLSLCSFEYGLKNGSLALKKPFFNYYLVSSPTITPSNATEIYLYKISPTSPEFHSLVV